MLASLTEKKSLKEGITKLVITPRNSRSMKKEADDEKQSGSKKMSFFAPKTYTMKKSQLLLSKDNTTSNNIEESLFNSSSESNFLAKSTFPKEYSPEWSDMKHQKRISTYFSEKSLSQQTQRILDILTKEKNKQKQLTENTLQSFIHKNFNEDMPDRLKTFEKFAFSNVERDEHKYIKPILSEIKTFKEPHGTMLITDLWSKNLQKECLEKSNMLKEKKMLEKYLFYKNKSKKTEKNDHLPMILTRKTEEVLKNEVSIEKKSPLKIMKRINLTKFRRNNEER